MEGESFTAIRWVFACVLPSALHINLVLALYNAGCLLETRTSKQEAGSLQQQKGEIGPPNPRPRLQTDHGWMR